MMLYFPNFFNNAFPQTMTTTIDGMHKILTGILIASFESLIFCPVERVKVMLVTKDTKLNFKS